MSRDIAVKVRELRKKLGLSQQDFAFKVGYSSGAMISKVEAGQRIPHWDFLQKMAKLAGLSMDYFFPVANQNDKKEDQDSYLAFLKFQQMVLKDELPSLADYLRIKYHYEQAEIQRFLDLAAEIDAAKPLKK